jgi:hypothetical protein
MENLAIISNENNESFFAYKILSNKNHVVGLDPYIVYESHRRKLSKFINMLYDPERKITYCLRTLTRIYNQKNTGGEINTYLLVKFPNNSAAKVKKLAFSIKLLLAGNFENTYWQELTTIEELKYALNPIPFEESHHAEIHRRKEEINLDSLLSEHSYGFVKYNDKAKSNKQQNSIFYVHPFTPPNGGFEKLVTTMLNSRQDMVFSSILSPTRLSDDEKEFLYKQISLCEGKTSPDGSKLSIPQSRSIGLTNALLKQYLLLQDAPYMMSFFVSSPLPIDNLILEFCGLALTEPVAYGAYADKLAHADLYNVGGYDVEVPQSNNEKAALTKCVEELSHHIWLDEEQNPIHHRLLHLVEANEALCSFYFPINAEINLSGMNVHSLVEHPLPRELVQLSLSSTPKLLIGNNFASGFEQEVFLPQDTRKQHTYIVGQTGTGKSTLMKTMIVSDMKAGNGLTVIDPHGELYNDLLEMIPESRKNDVVLLDPGDFLYPFGFNILEFDKDEQRQSLVKELKSIFKRLITEYFSIPGELIGPVFFQHVQNNMLLTMSDAENPGTLLEFYNIFQSKDYWRRWLPLKWQSPALESWRNILERSNYSAVDKGQRIGDYYSSKFEDFINDPRLANILGQPRSTININKIIEENKIMLVNLSKGLLGEANSSLFGMLVMAKINAALMSRVDLIRQGQKLTPHYLYVDEFQNIATENFSILLAEARKFGLGMILANQYLSQITNFKIRNAIFGNVGTVISFRLGIEDAKLLESEFAPLFAHQDLCNLPNYYAALRTNVRGERTTPCHFKTIRLEPEQGNVNKSQLLTLSRNKYGIPKKLAEFLLFSSLATPRDISQEMLIEEAKNDGTLTLNDFDLTECNKLIPNNDLHNQYIQTQTTDFKRRVIKYLMDSGRYTNKQVLGILEKLEAINMREILELPAQSSQIEKWFTNKQDQKTTKGFLLDIKKNYLMQILDYAMDFASDSTYFENVIDAKMLVDKNNFDAAHSKYRDALKFIEQNKDKPEAVKKDKRTAIANLLDEDVDF